MSDITRDDLRKPCAHEEDFDPHWTDDDEECPGWFSVTDEEFDRLARQAGYISLDDLMQRHIDIISLFPDLFPEKSQRRLLRALLTDECPGCGGTGIDPLSDAQPSGMDLGGHLLYSDEECPGCGGRGWLPKDGVEVHTEPCVADEGHEVLSFPLHRLEAEDA